MYNPHKMSNKKQISLQFRDTETKTHKLMVVKDMRK